MYGSEGGEKVVPSLWCRFLLFFRMNPFPPFPSLRVSEVSSLGLFRKDIYALCGVSQVPCKGIRKVDKKQRLCFARTGSERGKQPKARYKMQKERWVVFGDGVGLSIPMWQTASWILSIWTTRADEKP